MSAPAAKARSSPALALRDLPLPGIGLRTVSGEATQLIEAVGTLIGMSIDFPYSPVRLIVLMLPAVGSRGAS